MMTNSGHRRLADAIGFAILTGRIRPGDRLPTVRRLAVSLRVNANAVARAYAELERAGVVELAPDGGLTVCEPGRRP